MFNKEELDSLAEEARKKLNAQTQDADLYEEFNENEYEDDEVNYTNYNRSLNEVDLPKSDIQPIKQYDELLFPNGPSKLDVDMWKKDWTGYSIYVTEILDQPFIFRTLNRFEYKQLIAMQDTDALLREEIICQTVTLFPANYNWEAMATSYAGIPSTYAEIIMEKSGFTKDIAIQVL